MSMFEISITCHDQYGIQIYNNGQIKNFQKMRDFIKMAVMNNYTGSDYYNMKSNAKPFLQSDSDDFVMVEFWTHNFEEIEKYVEFLNKKYTTDWK